MLVAAAGAAALGAWAEGALLLFLFSFGHSLEAYAMSRAKRAIEALGELAPRTATVRRDVVVSDIPIEQLAIGDTVLVKPNERLAADGFVVSGASAIDQSPITGEACLSTKPPCGIGLRPRPGRTGWRPPTACSPAPSTVPARWKSR